LPLYFNSSLDQFTVASQFTMPSSAKTIQLKHYSHGLNRGIMPIINPKLEDCVKEVKKSDVPKSEEGGAYRRLRIARSDARHVGSREKRAKAKEDEAAAAKK